MVVIGQTDPISGIAQIEAHPTGQVIIHIIIIITTHISSGESHIRSGLHIHYNSVMTKQGI